MDDHRCWHRVVRASSQRLEPVDSVGGPLTAGPTGLNDVPSAAQLLEAVREFLESDVLAATEGRVRFHARVAANVVAMVGRELELGPRLAMAHSARLAGLGVANETELAAAIRSGGVQRSVGSCERRGSGDRGRQTLGRQPRLPLNAAGMTSPVPRDPPAPV